MRMMVVFEKGAQVRWIGHLDLMRAMQRALRRSGLPVEYSNGFHPHIRLSFASPLSVGVVGLRELMDVPLETCVEADRFAGELNAVLPDCLRVSRCLPLTDDFPSLMSLVAGADYRIRLFPGPEADRAAEAFDGFMSLAHYQANRRTKSGEAPCDIRPFVVGGSIASGEWGYDISLRTLQTAAGALKPSLWLQCLREYAQAGEGKALLYRCAILSRQSDGTFVAMEDLAHAL